MSERETGPGSARPTGGWRIAMGLLLMAGIAAVWFAIAGRVDWVEGWAFLILFTTFTTGLGVWLQRANPGLLAERRSRPAANIEPWDRSLVRWHTIVIVLLLVVAALDAGRYQWSQVSLLAETVAWAALAGSCGVIWHVFTVNTFLSTYARIQNDRGHSVVTGGLYGIVRHPMYAAVIVWALALPVALGSAWALLPGSMSAGLLVVRASREDRMLLGQLPGYQEYADRVRFRLLPGVW